MMQVQVEAYSFLKSYSVVRAFTCWQTFGIRRALVETDPCPYTTNNNFTAKHVLHQVYKSKVLTGDPNSRRPESQFV